MLYYNDKISEKYPQLLEYLKKGIYGGGRKISHCLLFWGADTLSQCELALETARLLNCKHGGSQDCDCLNCKWIREQTHPAVKIYTRLDYKESEKKSDEDSTKGKKTISAEQAKAIVNELSVSSDYHRVYIFCDRDEEGNLLPLNKINFSDTASNALLKTFEEPPENTTFIFLTNDKTDIISTVVSRAQSFFVPAVSRQDYDFSLVKDFICEYWNYARNDVFKFENGLVDLLDKDNSTLVFDQIQNYILSVIKSNLNNKRIFYKLTRDLEYVQEAKKQMMLTPAMNARVVAENLSFKLILQ